MAGSLDSMVVGLSVSESTDADLRSRGLSRLHLHHAFVEIARQLLSAGATIAYGGDLRRPGYTEILIDLLHTYAPAERPDRKRIYSYLAWPHYLQLNAESRARLMTVATVVEVEPAPRRGVVAPADIRERLRVADSQTAMRQRMTDDIHARLVLGGVVRGFIGRLPGVAEEALLAVQAEKPLYVVGGFGGCSGALAALLEGGEPAELAYETLVTDENYAALAQFLPEIRPDTIWAPLREAGIAGLRNALTDEENRALFASSDIDQIIALLRRALARVSIGGPPA